MWLALLLTVSAIARDYWAPGNQTWMWTYSIILSFSDAHTLTHTPSHMYQLNIYLCIHLYTNMELFQKYMTLWHAMESSDVLQAWWVHTVSSSSFCQWPGRKLDETKMTGRNTGVRLNMRDNNPFLNSSDTGSLLCSVFLEIAYLYQVLGTHTHDTNWPEFTFTYDCFILIPRE